MSNPKYIHYGCGLDAPTDWLNFDASPTLRLQKIPVLNTLLRKRFNVIFPQNVMYGDIVKGLPGIAKNSCKGVFCSHILEHLSLSDFRKALVNSYNILENKGMFRLVVPDLEFYIESYINSRNENSAMEFMQNTLLGKKNRERGIYAFLENILGNSRHLWMWDYLSIAKELQNCGFVEIRRCQYGDCEDEMFSHVERESRFKNSLAVECRKPA